MWGFNKKAGDTSPTSSASQARKGDGTIIGDLIEKGIYSATAGTEKVGYFDPACSPFRTFPNGKCGLACGAMADQLLEMLSDPAVASMAATMGLSGGGDVAVELGRKLSLRSTREVLETFQAVANEDSVGKYLIVTTTMPFHLTHWVGKRIAIAEVEQELKLNALANLLLNDPDFASVRDRSQFQEKASALWDSRTEEVERMKQWAIERM
jgi:hypothetical protein